MRSWLNGCLTKSPRRGDTETRNTAWEQGGLGKQNRTWRRGEKRIPNYALIIPNQDLQCSILNSQLLKRITIHCLLTLIDNHNCWC